MKKQMTDVEKSIHEESDKIASVKKIVRARSAAIESTQFSPEELSTDEWKGLPFSQPETTVRLGTVFSGIGAIEHAFQRLKLKHKIVFAGDFFFSAPFNGPAACGISFFWYVCGLLTNVLISTFELVVLLKLTGLIFIMTS